MFALLAIVFPFLFYIGCFTHVLDLLIELWAVMAVIITVVGNFRFMTVFVNKHPMLKEAFDEIRRNRHGTRTMNVRNFSDTRFMHADLMLNRGVYNEDNLRDLALSSDVEKGAW